MRGWKVVPVLLVLLFTASASFAGGFRLPEAGAKAMGMGFAFTAQADDPSAIYYNPAGLTQLKGQNVMAGVTYVRENGGKFTGTTPLTGGATESETQKTLDFYIPNAYYTRTTNSGNVSYGVGIFAPFGLGQEYKNRDTSIFRNQITNIDLQTIVVNPTIAFNLNEVLSIGGGIDFLYGKAKLAKTLVLNNVAPGVPIGDNPVNVYNLGLEGDGTAWGYNFGLLLVPSKNVKVGFSYRSPFRLEIKDGDVDLRNISGTPIVPLGGATPQMVFGGTSFSTKGTTTVNLPATAALGVSCTFNRLTVNADADWTFWHSYSSLNVAIKDDTALLTDTSSEKNWRDVMAVRIGAEYRVIDPLSLRLGFAYDPSPVPAETMGPELPDAARLQYMVGGGYKFRDWTFDLAYMYIDKRDRTVNNQGSNQVPPAGGVYPQYASGFNGTWSGDAHLVSFDIGYKF